MPALILVVEAEPTIQSLIEVTLRRAGYDVLVAGSADRAWRLIDEVVPSLLLIDWMLDGLRGIDLIRRLRADSRTGGLPVVVMTTDASDEHSIEALGLSVDGYVAKSFRLGQLVASIGAILRRNSPPANEIPISLGGLTINPVTHRVTAHGKTVDLGPTEFRLLYYLMAHPERVHSRSALLDEAWGDHVFVEERTVDVHIRRIREKLEPSGCNRQLQTVRGAGYRCSATNE
jgi:two-component system phosphate regulon response regulator PhoB